MNVLDVHVFEWQIPTKKNVKNISLPAHTLVEMEKDVVHLCFWSTPKIWLNTIKSSPQSQHAANFWTINLPNFISNKRTFLLKLLMLWKLYGITSSSSQPLHFAYWFCIETVVEKLFNSWTIHSLEKHFSVVLILFFSKPILKGMSVLDGKSRKVCAILLI